MCLSGASSRRPPADDTGRRVEGSPGTRAATDEGPPELADHRRSRVPGPRGCYLWDTELAGYGVWIHPSGRKSFVVTYSARGRQRFYTLGRNGELTPHQARTEALDTLARARKGEDPAGDRIAARRAPTVDDLADRHIRDHARTKYKPPSVKRARQLWDRSVLPHLGRRRVADIRRADVAKLMTDMAETPAMANKALSLLSKAFNLAEVWGWRPEGTNPAATLAATRKSRASDSSAKTSYVVSVTRSTTSSSTPRPHPTPSPPSDC